VVEQFWRRAGVQLGKHWKVVLAVTVLITVVLGTGLTRLEFATGQDSYLNPESQIAIDNVEFQDDFGGETVILLFTASEGSDATVEDLYEGRNLEELDRITAELEEVEEAYAVVTPRVSLEFSDALLSQGVGSTALLSAASRDEAGAEARQADIAIALARLAAAGDQVVGNPTYNELLIYGNDNFELDASGELIPPADEDRAIRLSLASTFPDPQTAVGGIVLQGNATLDEQSEGTEKALAILDTAQFDGFDLTVTGSPVYLAEINDYLQGGMITLGLAALAVMAVILALIFRVRWRLLPLLAVFIGVLWAFSIVGLVGIDLSLVTISGLPILIGLGIDFAIQMQNRVEEEVVLDRAPHPISETMANLAPALIAAAVTAVLAVLALRISKVPMIRDFGVLLAIGILVLVAVGIVIPASVLGIREWKTPTEERKPSLVERAVVWLGGLPASWGPALIAISVVLFVGGVFAEGEAEIQSDPIEWIDQDSEVVADVRVLEDETGFGTTLGVLVAANNVYDQEVVDLINDFTVAAESREDGAVVSSSSLVNTMGKIITIEGATVISPTSADVVAASEVMPPAVGRALVRPDGTATQVNLRIKPASLEERAVIVEELQADLDARIAALEPPPDSVLLVDLPEGQDPVKATPAGLATVGIGLLENLSANRANLTYLALCLAGLFLVLRFRSLSRALLALTPVMLAVGASSLFVGLSGIKLSPLTTVSGPLVIATCAEFSVLILSRYLEERQIGRDPRDATDTAARRTGRAFFTSAMTTIGGFAVLIGSALPLLSDFGIIVSLNVAIALLAALVVVPPLAVWVDRRGWLGTQEQGVHDGSVRMAAPFPGGQTVGMAVGAVAFTAVGVADLVAADTSTGTASNVAYAETPLPTTTTTTTTTTTLPPPTTVEGEEAPETTEPAGPAIDPAQFSGERPTDGILKPTLFDLLVGGGDYVGQGVDPQTANCTIETAVERFGEDELLLGLPGQDQPAIETVTQAAIDCGLDASVVDGALAEFLGG